MSTKHEWFSGGVRKEHVVTKDENGPETIEEYLDRAKQEFLDAMDEFPPDE